MDADLIALLERVKNGNDKLWAAWRVIRNVPDPEEKADLFLKWDGRVNFLNLLCKELIVKGYNECLYIENGIKTKACLNNPDEPEWFCNTCPAAIGGAKVCGAGADGLAVVLERVQGRRSGANEIP